MSNPASPPKLFRIRFRYRTPTKQLEEVLETVQATARAKAVAWGKSIAAERGWYFIGADLVEGECAMSTPTTETPETLESGKWYAPEMADQRAAEAARELESAGQAGETPWWHHREGPCNCERCRRALLADALSALRELLDAPVSGDGATIDRREVARNKAGAVLARAKEGRGE